MPVFDLYHGYIYGTSFWYALRGACRIYDPLMVIGWFRPPAQRNLAPNDLEVYNVWNDAWGLMTLAGVLLSFAKVVPHGSGNADESARHAKPYARAVILATIFHHVTTAYGAYQHYKLDSHYNISMGIGVWANVFLTLVGSATLLFDQDDARRTKKVM